MECKKCYRIWIRDVNDCNKATWYVNYLYEGMILNDIGGTTSMECKKCYRI